MRLRNGVRALRTSTTSGGLSQKDIVALQSSVMPLAATRNYVGAAPHQDIDADPVAWAHRVIDDLSHDLRQPLTAISMNLQCAMRLLQAPTPRLSPAVEALSDCLSTEAAIVDLVEHAQRRLNALLGEDRTFSLNSLADDIVLTVRSFEPLWADRLERRLGHPAPQVAASAPHVRMALLAMLRRLLLLEEFEAHPLNRLVIETRTVAPNAELLITGIHASFAIGPFVRPLIELVGSIARRFGGNARLDVEDRRACFVVALPLAGDDSSSTYGGGDGE
ncbi:MAG: hypothetical protein ACJ796_15735 [Gemmatimonadaceae bacterium]